MKRVKFLICGPFWVHKVGTQDKINERAQLAADFGEKLLADPAVKDKSSLYSELIHAYGHTGQPDKVKQMQELRVQADPKSSWALLNYASFLNSVGEYAKAAENARAAIKIADVGMAHLNLAQALAGLAKYDRIQRGGDSWIPLCNEALEHDPKNLACLFELRNHNLLMSRAPNADPKLGVFAQQLEEAYVAISRSPEAHFHGEAYALPSYEALVAAGTPGPQRAQAKSAPASFGSIPNEPNRAPASAPPLSAAPILGGTAPPAGPATAADPAAAPAAMFGPPIPLAAPQVPAAK